jgi:hypothetical protein
LVRVEMISRSCSATAARVWIVRPVACGLSHPTNANGGFADLLQVTNGNLYAKQADGLFWVRWPPPGSPPPHRGEGTVATKVSLALVSSKIPDNSPSGTVIAKATVTMSPASAKFTGPLVSTNPLYMGEGGNVVLSRALTAADHGLHSDHAGGQRTRAKSRN